MDPYFDQKTFLVTGGASGIGRETARMLVARGAAVSIADRDVHELENTAAAISKEFSGARILTTKLDVRDPSAANEWIARTESQLGNVYGCVNAAGISPPSHLRLTIEETPIEEWDNTIGVNLTGVMICMREEVRAMKKSGVRGSIVNIASAAGLVGIERGSPYSVSKWGVIGLTRSVAKETAKYGIRVTGVAP